MEFKDKLSIQRKQKNYSQEQLADMVGVSRQSVSKWETGESYPDMAKIIQLCKLLDCELTELLDDGVLSEVKSDAGESSQTKGKQLIDYFNGFLDFVTKTYNMFIHMTFKSKITMIIELLFLFTVITAICALVQAGIVSIIRPIIYLLPDGINFVINRIVVNILTSIIAIVGIIVFIHLFKIRYLDYYVTITDSKATEQTVEEPIEDNRNSSELVSSPSPKIVIRDPEHSSSKFIEFLANIVIIIFKCLVVICAIPAIAGFVGFVAIGVISLANISSGSAMVFLYAFMAFAGCAAFCYILVHFAFNVIFSRKQPLKQFLIVFVAALVLIGAGSGLTVNKISTFDSTITEFKTEKIVIDNADEIDSLEYWTSEVEYIIKDDATGIEIEAQIPEDYRLVAHMWDLEISAEDGTGRSICSIYSFLAFDGPFDALGSVISHLKEGKFFYYDAPTQVGSVKVALSQETLDRLHPANIY